jgi:uncharacterized repeat protein (TIGR03837 family)
MIWDIFCRVIDNYGDIGICWRLSADLAARGAQVRLWVDDASALEWMAPGARQGQWPGVQVLDWSTSHDPAHLGTLPLADVWVEGFGCDMAPEFVAHSVPRYQAAGQRAPVWLNLEYLSAEPYVERCHGLQSPVMQGAARGWHKTFFYPGFGPNTGGLLHEPGLEQHHKAFGPQDRQQFLQRYTAPRPGEQAFSLFCYAPALLPALLRQLAQQAQPTLLLVAYGSTQSMLRQCLADLAWPDPQALGALRLVYLPALSQPDFDQLLLSCDLNFVRGEDSVIRALWAGKPFVWHIYPQSDGAHSPKLEAFLQRLHLGEPVTQVHRAWNGLASDTETTAALELLCTPDRTHWQATVQAARSKLLNLHDLTSALNDFVQKKR